MIESAYSERIGAVYTKPWVVTLILDLAGYVASEDLGGRLAIEPAAGDGSFVGPMVDRLLESCQLFGRSIEDCTNAFMAYEIDSGAATRCSEIIRERLRANEVAPQVIERLIDSWIRRGDYLLEWQIGSQADFVIGNPPYVRPEDLPRDLLAKYRSHYPTMIGRADLYVAFFERALKQLVPTGVCAFICADRWMLNQYGAELRRLITSGYSVETVIELHRAAAFETEVSAYPAITVIRRSAQQSVAVARINGAIDCLDSVQFRSALEEAEIAPNVTVESNGFKVGRLDNWFTGTDPWPCYSPERLTLLKRLEAEFYPLEAWQTGTKVGIGVATGADNVFVTQDAELAEPDRILPIAMAKDTLSGSVKWSGHYLVNPWNSHGLVNLDSFPKLRQHLETHREQLASRHVGKRGPHWYRTIDRVTESLTNRPKLYIADIKDRLSPVLDTGETYPHHNLYFVQSDQWDLEVLGGILLSDIGQFFIECYAVRMRGGYLRYQAQYLRRIRVPRPFDISADDAEQLRLAFRNRDRELASEVAFRIYGITELPPEEHSWTT